ncbi:MAG: hypothetical protein K0B02_00490 [DPANN group archaeon]|nr:hypothetical protein [DPANN group archaeon]
MHPLLEKIEHFVDKIIPYLLLMLITITLSEIFIHETVVHYEHTIHLIDNFIIYTFILDLIFKYNRVRNIPKFIRSYWIDILAVFPFYLTFRFIEVVTTSQLIEESQKALHIATESEKELSRTIKEVKEVKLASRVSKMTKEIRILNRLPRLIKALHFYEKPNIKKKDLEIWLSVD